MADTITAFHNFSAGTKARSTQVNTNFSNFRGHLVAIDPNTATAMNLTYDLGTSEYQWRKLWVGEARISGTLSVLGITTTANLSAYADGSITSGSFPVKVGTTQIADLKPAGPGFKKNLVMFGETAALWTPSAAYSQVTNTTMSITSSGLGPIEVGIWPGNGYSAQLIKFDAAGVELAELDWYWLKDGGTTIGASKWVHASPGWSVTAAGLSDYIPASAFKAVDPNPAAGGHTYQLFAKVLNASNASISFVRYIPYAMEY
jgi:hypothetical protein